MAKKAKTKDVVKKTIEQTLWDSANELRGNLDAAEYKSVVLGLVFLKYINDCFKVKHDELVAEGEGFEEDPDEYIGDNIFFVPVDARWEKVVNASLTAEIGAVVDAAMEALEKENKQLKGILPKNYARPELDKRRLGNVIDIFENNLECCRFNSFYTCRNLDRSQCRTIRESAIIRITSDSFQLRTFLKGYCR